MSTEDFKYWLKIYEAWLETNPPKEEINRVNKETMDFLLCRNN